jgi:hypothetical protein
MRRSALFLAVLLLASGTWPGFGASDFPMAPARAWAAPQVVPQPQGEAPGGSQGARPAGARARCTCEEVVIDAVNEVRGAEVTTGDATVRNNSLTFIGPGFSGSKVRVRQRARAETGDAIAGQVIGVIGGGRQCGGVRVEATNEVINTEILTGDARAINESVIRACDNDECLEALLNYLRSADHIQVCDDGKRCRKMTPEELIAWLGLSRSDSEGTTKTPKPSPGEGAEDTPKEPTEECKSPHDASLDTKVAAPIAPEGDKGEPVSHDEAKGLPEGQAGERSGHEDADEGDGSRGGHEGNESGSKEGRSPETCEPLPSPNAEEAGAKGEKEKPTPSPEGTPEPEPSPKATPKP